MKIKKVTSLEFSKLSVLAREYGSVFNHTEWLQLYGDTVERYSISEDSGTTIGGFYLYHTRRTGLTHITNPPYSPHIGLFLLNKSQNKSNSLSFEKGVMSLLAEFFNTLPCKILTVAFPLGFTDMQPFFWKRFKVIPNYTYRYNLTESTEALTARMSPERRNDIKKAQKDNIQVRQVTDYTHVLDLVLKTFDRKEKSVNIKLIQKILFEFANEKNSFAFVSEKNGKPTACSFCIHDGKGAYYLLGGYDKQNKHQGAGAAAVWSAVQFAKQTGLQYFDFEGSMIPQVEKYFRGFGGDLLHYFTVNKAKVPVEVALKFVKRELF
jgi:hypothetical protein